MSLQGRTVKAPTLPLSVNVMFTDRSNIRMANVLAKVNEISRGPLHTAHNVDGIKLQQLATRRKNSEQLLHFST